MHKYILTSSLNFNSIMSTHIIGSEKYYKERLYGTNRFYKLATDGNSELIRLFDVIPSEPSKLLLNEDCEEYLVIIEIDDYMDIIELDGNTYIKGPVYLDTTDHKITFCNEQEKKIILVKSQIVAEVKYPICYHPNKNNFILEDSVRNSLKGSCLMSLYILNKYNIDISHYMYGITHSELDDKQTAELKEYWSDVKELKRANRNSVAENNISKLVEKWIQDKSDPDIELMRYKIVRRDTFVNLTDIKSVVKRGVALFLMKYNKIEEIDFIKTDDVSRSIALLLYGCYKGFSSLDRIIYKECKPELFHDRWLHWLVYFYVARNDMNKGLDNSSLADMSAFE